MVKQIRDYVLEARLIRESKEQKNEDANSEILSETLYTIGERVEHLGDVHKILHKNLEKAMNNNNIQEIKRLLKNSDSEKIAKEIVASFNSANNIANKMKEFSLESSQKNEASITGRNDIDFDSFGGSINVFADDEQNGVEVGLNSSSRGNIYYTKDIKKDDNEDYTAFYKRCSALAYKDKQELLKKLKPIADEFDRKVQTIMQQFGYKRK